jgi:hypothetical protein
MGHFHFKGPLPPDSELFVGRQKELKTVLQLCMGPLRSYITIVGARQTGKTSFLYRLQRLLTPPSRSVLINFQVLPDATPNSVFQFMATQLCRQLNMPGLAATAEEIRSGSAFQRFLRELPDQVGRVVVLVDEIGALPQKTAVYLANVLRAVFSNRLLSGFEALGRFVFVLAGGSELLDLTMSVVSPFSNISTRVYLPDLTLGEVRQLMAYGLAGIEMSVGLVHELAEAIYLQTHGHPYLTQRAGAYMAEYAEQEGGTPELSWVDRARDQMLAEDENVNHVRHVLQEPTLLSKVFQTTRIAMPFRLFDRLLEKLHLLGVIRDENGIAVPRNAIYTQVIMELAEQAGMAGAEALSPTTAPKLSIKILTSIVPTAFCHNLTAEDFPLVQVTVDNTVKACRLARVYVAASIEGFSDTAVSSVAVPEGETREVSLLPILQLAPRMTLSEIRPATLHISVRQMGCQDELLLHDQTYPIRLHAFDTALLAIRTAEGRIVDLTEHLCAFVTPHAPEIEDLLRKAAEYHPRRQIVGYQGAGTIQEARHAVREQVRAIYNALKHEAGLVYINSPLNFGKQEGQITQRVRLPVTSLEEHKSRANCIDGTVLYASLLELASLQPLLVIGPGHAFIAWRTWQDLDDYEFLETTMTGTGDFDAALETGRRQYEDAKAKGFFQRELFDASGFARLIDVAACRAKQIYPLM